ncbi:MAG TPA: hypothetical protein RMF84_20540 [Polyangiaceae bacterium LLY-WYZ-14_1]|nr:hypothetical protein [Polyangiaceae bacterium LLY-WYZ-14_1]
MSPFDPAPRRLRRLSQAAGALVLALGLVGAHAAAARRRWAQEAAAREAALRFLPSADLALSSTSRWLRHPALAEPGAPFADAPALLDPDPAGALLAPPRSAFAEVPGGTVELVVRAADGPPARVPASSSSSSSSGRR